MVTPDATSRVRTIIRATGAVFIGLELVAVLVTTITTSTSKPLAIAATILTVAAWFTSLIIAITGPGILITCLAVTGGCYILTTVSDPSITYNQSAIWLSLVTLAAGLLLSFPAASATIITVTIVGTAAIMYRANEFGQAGSEWPDIFALSTNAVGLGFAAAAGMYFLYRNTAAHDTAAHAILDAEETNAYAAARSAAYARLRTVTHNTLANTFTAIATTDNLPADLIAARAHDDLTQLQRLSGTLHTPAAVDYHPLMWALNQRAVHARTIGVPDLTITWTDNTTPQLDRDTVNDMCDIIAELLLNITKHAHAAGCSINVTTEGADTHPERVTVTVTDNGVGYPSTTVPHVLTTHTNSALTVNAASHVGTGTTSIVTWTRPHTSTGSTLDEESRRYTRTTLTATAVGLSAPTSISVYIQSAFLSIKYPRTGAVIAGSIAVAAIAAAVWSVWVHARLTLIAVITGIVALVPVTLIDAYGLTRCQQISQTFWGPLASAILLAAICFLADRWWIIVTACAVNFVTIIWFTVNVAGLYDCTNDTVSKLVSRIALAVGATALGIYTRRLAAWHTNALHLAAQTRHNSARINADSDIIKAHLNGTLHESQRLLTRLATNPDINDTVRATCAQQAQLVRILITGDTVAVDARAALADIVAACHTHGISVTITTLDFPTTGPQAQALAKALHTFQVDPTSTSVTISTGHSTTEQRLILTVRTGVTHETATTFTWSLHEPVDTITVTTRAHDYTGTDTSPDTGTGT